MIVAPAYHDVCRTIGINIAYYRSLCDLSQEELADKLNIDQSHMSKIERAVVGVSIKRLCDIARELNVAPYQLLKPLE